MLISVVMSIYNENVDFVRRSVYSILNQTYKKFEFIIVIDDPNNKEVIDFLEHLRLEDNRINLLKNEVNLGLSKSLNKAIKQSKGEYIVRMDADDISLDNRIERQLNFMIENKLDMSSCLIKNIDDKEEILYVQKSYNSNLYSKKLSKLLKYRCIMSHPSWCVKRELYFSLNFYRDLVPVEDYDFILRASEKNYKLGILNEYLLLYRNNMSGISNSQLVKQKIMSYLLRDNYGNLADISEDSIKSLYEEKLSKNKVDFLTYEKYRKNMLSRKLSISEFIKIVVNINYLLLFFDDILFILVKKVYRV